MFYLNHEETSKIEPFCMWRSKYFFIASTMIHRSEFLDLEGTSYRQLLMLFKINSFETFPIKFISTNLYYIFRGKRLNLISSILMAIWIEKKEFIFIVFVNCFLKLKK